MIKIVKIFACYLFTRTCVYGNFYYGITTMNSVNDTVSTHDNVDAVAVPLDRLIINVYGGILKVVN